MKRAIAVLALVTLLPGCGLFEKLTGSGDEQQTKSANQAQQTKPTNHEPPAPKPVTSIPPEKLSELLPKMDGWETQPPVGEFIPVGEHKVSRATGTYSRMVETLPLSATLRIVDGSYASDVYAPLTRMAHTRAGEVTGHKMSITIEGNPGIQQFKTESGKVEVVLVVAKRFLITLEGQNLSPQVVQEFLHGIDVKKLMAWAGTKPVLPSTTPARPH